MEEISVDPQRALRRAEEAIELVREWDDPSLLAQALMDKFIAEAVLGHGAHREVLEEALALEASSAGSDGRVPTRLVPLDRRSRRDADALPAAGERCREHGDAVGAAEIVEFLAMAEFRAGNWDQAERALEDACTTLGQFDLRGPLTASFADRR